MKAEIQEKNVRYFHFCLTVVYAECKKRGFAGNLRLIGEKLPFKRKKREAFCRLPARYAIRNEPLKQSLNGDLVNFGVVALRKIQGQNAVLSLGCDFLNVDAVRKLELALEDNRLSVSAERARGGH